MAFNLAKCDFCGDCLDLCKYTTYDRTTGADQIRRLVRGEDAEIVTECVTCAACNAYCSKGANPFDLIVQRQEKSGLYRTTPSYFKLVESIDQSPGEIQRGEPGRPVFNLCAVDVIPGLFEGELFEGCTFLRGGAYESLLAWIHVGRESPLRKTLQRKVDALAATGYSEIVMFHDDCYAAYTTKALEYGIDVPFRVVHYVEYLRDALRQRRSRLKPLGWKIAYQQPCSSRYTPWMDRCLDELFDLTGVERVARTYDRLNALCCGSTVSPHLGHEAGESYKARNIRDALDHGARAMVFMCPFCALQMREEAAKAGLEPVFLTNLARMALGEKLSAHPAGLGDVREPIAAAVQIVKGLL